MTSDSPGMAAPPAVRNPLLEQHERSGAEFQPYGPIQIVSTFGEPEAEYAAMRKACGLMDLPQRGVLELSGRDRLEFLNNLLTNQTWDKQAQQGLQSGRATYAFFLNLRGRIVADVNVLELGDRTLLETDARLVGSLRGVFDRYLFAEQVTLVDRSDALHEIALHGPGAAAIVTALTAGTLTELAMMDVRQVSIGSVEAIIWRDDPAGVPGYHLIIPTEKAANLWAEILNRFGGSESLGKRLLRPIGWAAFNVARVEAGRPMLDIDFAAAPPDLPGKNLTEADLEAAAQASGANVGVLPAETDQLGRAVSFTKGCYLGQEVVARMHARGALARKIVGIRMESDALPLAGAKLLDGASNEVGVVTSSAISPMLSNTAVGLAYLRKPHFAPGTKLTVAAEGAMRPATVAELPFLK